MPKRVRDVNRCLHGKALAGAKCNLANWIKAWADILTNMKAPANAAHCAGARGG